MLLRFGSIPISVSNVTLNYIWISYTEQVKANLFCNKCTNVEIINNLIASSSLNFGQLPNWYIDKHKLPNGLAFLRWRSQNAPRLVCCERDDN